MIHYTTAIGDQICELRATSSNSLKEICEQVGVPYSTVTSWLYDRNHEMHIKYAAARQRQLTFLAEEVLEIAANSDKMSLTVTKDGTMKVKYKTQNDRDVLRVQARLFLIKMGNPPQKRKKKPPIDPQSALDDLWDIYNGI